MRIVLFVASFGATLLLGLVVGSATAVRPVDATSSYAATSTVWATSTVAVAPTTDRFTARLTATRTATDTAHATATQTAHATVTEVDTITPTPQYADVMQAVTYYADCKAARKAHAAPLHRGDPGYRAALDRDGDGRACE